MTRIPTIADLQRHAQDLAAAFKLRLIECAQLKPDEALALKLYGGLAFVSPIVDETTYAVALHELGHLVAPTGALRAAGVVGDRANLKRDEEDAAWTWARHYALTWTPVMDALAHWAEGTYAAAPSAPPAPPALPQRIDWTRYTHTHKEPRK